MEDPPPTTRVPSADRPARARKCPATRYRLWCIDGTPWGSRPLPARGPISALRPATRWHRCTRAREALPNRWVTPNAPLAAHDGARCRVSRVPHNARYGADHRALLGAARRRPARAPAVDRCSAQVGAGHDMHTFTYERKSSWRFTTASYHYVLVAMITSLINDIIFIDYLL